MDQKLWTIDNKKTHELICLDQECLNELKTFGTIFNFKQGELDLDSIRPITTLVQCPQLIQCNSIITLPPDTALFSRSFYEQPYLSNKPQWFAFEYGYGSAESYGPHIHKYIVKRPIHVINISQTQVRHAIGDLIDRYNIQPHSGCISLSGKEILERAWGEGCNFPAAEVVCELSSKLHLDGWIAKDWDDEDMEGPEELMLCNSQKTLTHYKF
jgi:hypothetical protein